MRRSNPGPGVPGCRWRLGDRSFSVSGSNSGGNCFVETSAASAGDGERGLCIRTGGEGEIERRRGTRGARGETEGQGGFDNRATSVAERN